ncbi:hypothetical protein Nepgr_019966 [Nepenthes gracilis]|uniref:Uncharacterized protein n=1 Tax=Nepenthes gracilis TaxID=150966 RepID=A0AAD3SUG2_NEPGR|nr:hypothetical protein Nepgr_019966 [Nepenthes gracilis]
MHSIRSVSPNFSMNAVTLFRQGFIKLIAALVDVLLLLWFKRDFELLKDQLQNKFDKVGHKLLLSCGPIGGWFQSTTRHANLQSCLSHSIITWFCFLLSLQDRTSMKKMSLLPPSAQTSMKKTNNLSSDLFNLSKEQKLFSEF